MYLERDFLRAKNLNRGHPGKEYVGKMALHADSKSPWSWDRFGVGDLEFGIWGEGESAGEGERKKEI